MPTSGPPAQVRRRLDLCGLYSHADAVVTKGCRMHESARFVHSNFDPPVSVHDKGLAYCC
jgi:hypothetical protein